MSSANDAGSRRFVESLRGELPDRLQHPHALLADPPRASAEEALVEERLECVEVRLADFFTGLEGAPCSEDREPCEECPLGLVEQVVRPRDGRPQRRVSLVGVSRPSEEVEPLPETLEERLRREQLRPGGSELERKRQTIEPFAELADRRRRRRCRDGRRGHARRRAPRLRRRREAAGRTRALPGSGVAPAR